MSGIGQEVIDRGLLAELEQAVGRESFRSLFTALLGQVRQTGLDLERALASGDSGEIERHAHSLVSPAGHIGAMELAEASRALAKSARTLAAAGERQALPALSVQAETVLDLMRRSIAELTIIETRFRPL